MTWSDFYLVCFLVGALLSVLSFLLGSFHFPAVHVHHGPIGGHGLDFGQGHPHFGHVHGHGPGGEIGEQVAGAMRAAHVPFLNFGTITAFLTWFGGAGYLLTRYSSVWLWVGMLLAAAAGIFGASIVFWFVAKVLLRHEKDLDPADYDMVGVLGRVSSSIRAGGTGEIIYSQEGTRHTAGARSEDGRAIERGAEVVVTRYERGIAYVRRWEELANGTAAAESTGNQ